MKLNNIYLRKSATVLEDLGDSGSITPYLNSIIKLNGKNYKVTEILEEEEQIKIIVEPSIKGFFDPK